MDRLQKLGRDLGYEGKDLQDFVAQENKRERDERAAEREIEKAKIAAEEAKLLQQREIELAKVASEEAKEKAKIAQQREIELAKVEAAKIAKENEFELARLTAEEANKLRDIELAKLAAEEARVLRDNEIELAKLTQQEMLARSKREHEKDKEIELARLHLEHEKLKMEQEIEHEKLKMEQEVKLTRIDSQERQAKLDSDAKFASQLEHGKLGVEKAAHARNPKLPYFEESKDKMDSYLSRFEKYAVANKWEPDVMDSEIKEMLELGVIEKSVSPYSSPVVLVPKKDGSVRFCIDFRKLNKVTEFDAEPMPNMEEVINGMSGNKFFTRMDCSKGYWQVCLPDNCKHLTAFETPQGLFQFKTMPFGLVNSGATFCRLMRQVLANVPNVDSFVDDMWIFTETWEAHMTSLRQVLDRLRSAKLTAKPSKCFIGYSSIECLGHNIVGQTVRPQEYKIHAIREATRPQTKRQMKSFLRLAGFYRRFIPSFSSIASPLTDLTKKDRPNSIKDWQDKHEKAFQTLKTRLTSSPILRLPVFRDEIPFVLRTDASDVGVGAVLLQEFEGEGRLPIAYTSKKLLPREKNYSTIEKECLGIIWGIEKFRKYLYGVEFLLETDHKPLSYLQTAKVLNPRIMRWAMRLQPYRFRIIAIRGQDNLGADYLSR